MKNAKFVTSTLVLILLSVTSIGAQTLSLSTRNSIQVGLILGRLEAHSGKFRVSLNSALVQSRIDQTRSENDISSFETGFENATDQLRRKLRVGLAGVTDVEGVLRLATLINGFLDRYPLNRQVHSDWAVVRTDLNGLAKAFGLTWHWNREAARSVASGRVQLSGVEIGKIIQRIEAGGDTFRTSLTEAVALQPYDRTLGESRLNDAVRGFQKETHQLRIQFEDRQPIGPYVDRLFSRATSIESFLRGNFKNSQALHDDWLTLRADLNKLGDASTTLPL